MSHAHHVLHVPRTPVLLIALVAVVALDLGLAYAVERPGGALHPELDAVSSLTWTSDGVQLSTGGGFEAHLGTEVALVLTDTDCLIDCPTLSFQGAATTPSSFVVVETNLPAIAPGTTGNLTVTVKTPSSPYSGPLTIDLVSG